jgi:hypothetical protein
MIHIQTVQERTYEVECDFEITLVTGWTLTSRGTHRGMVDCDEDGYRAEKSERTIYACEWIIAPSNADFDALINECIDRAIYREFGPTDESMYEIIKINDKGIHMYPNDTETPEYARKGKQFTWGGNPL